MYKEALQLSKQVAYLWDPVSGKVERDGVEALLGYNGDEEIQNMEWYCSKVHRADLPEFRKSLQKAKTSKEIITRDYRIMKKDGTFIRVEETSQACLNSYGKVEKVIGVLKDITEKKSLEQRCLESEEILHNFLKNARSMMGVVTFKDGEIIPAVFNDACCMLKYGKRLIEYDTGGKPKIEEITAELWASLFKRALKLKGAVRTETHYRHNEKVFYQEVTISFVTVNGRGDPIFIFVVEDITRQRLFEENLARSIIEAEDAERMRIAKELHDGIVQYLTAAHMNFAVLSGSIQKNRTEYEYGLSLLQRAIIETRNIAHNLMPQEIKDFGLSISGRSLIKSLASSTRTEFSYYDNLKEEPLPLNLQINLFRIIQEAVSNILKYANAQTADIQIIKHDDELILSIEDDGKGFDPGIKTKGIGLKNIENRVNALNGFLEISTAPRVGTNIMIYIPFNRITVDEHQN